MGPTSGWTCGHASHSNGRRTSGPHLRQDRLALVARRRFLVAGRGTGSRGPELSHPSAAGRDVATNSGGRISFRRGNSPPAGSAQDRRAAGRSWPVCRCLRVLSWCHAAEPVPHSDSLILRRITHGRPRSLWTVSHGRDRTPSLAAVPCRLVWLDRIDRKLP